MCEKLALENFFQDNALFFKNFDLKKMCKNEIEDDNEQIKISRFGEKLSYKIDFTAFGLHRDRPTAYELNLNNLPILDIGELSLEVVFV